MGKPPALQQNPLRSKRINKGHAQTFFACFTPLGKLSAMLSQKTIGFLEILYYLTKYAANYPLTIFTKLEKDIREFYVTNPELTWNITRPEIQEFIHQAEYKHKKILLEAVGANPHNQATSTPAYSPAIPSSSPNAKKSLNFNSPQSGSSGGCSVGKSRGKGKISHERPKIWNFCECYSKTCEGDHVCWYCGGSHTGKDCRCRP